MSYYSSVVLADSPIRYYRLGDTSGTVATDLGSQAQNGTVQTGVTLNQTRLLPSGDSNPSMLFNGTAGNITLPTTGLPTGASAWTIEAWVKTTVVTIKIIAFFGTDVANEAAELYLSSGTNGFECDLDGATSVKSASAPTTGVVYHVVGTYDGTQARLYINGSLVGGPTTITANIIASVGLIGKSPSGFFWSGNLQEVAFYSSALSAARVLAHYNAGWTVALLCTLDGSGTLTETFQLATALTMTTAAAGTLSGTLSILASTVSLACTLAGAGPLLGTSSAQLTLPGGTLAGAGQCTAMLAAATAFTTSIAGVGTLSGGLGLSIALPVTTLGGTGSLVGTWTAIQTDTFIRANQSGWGTASDGQIWTNTGDTANIVASIVSNQGKLTGSAADNYFVLGDGCMADGEILVRISTSAINTSNFQGALLRYQVAGKAYACYIRGNTLYLVRILSNVFTTLQTFAVTLAASTEYWLRFNATGTTLSGKIWAASGSEPGGWQVTGTDTNFTSGQFGLFSSPDVAGTVTLFDTFTATSTPAAYYVAPTGNDSNAGTSASPWLTIGHAVTHIGLGDTVHLATGTYTEQVTMQYSGTPRFPLTFVSDTKWGALITLNDSTINTMVLVAAKHITIDGIQFSAIHQHFGLNVSSGGGDVIVRNCWLHDIGTVSPQSSDGPDGTGAAIGVGSIGISAPILFTNNLITTVGYATGMHAYYIDNAFSSYGLGIISNNLIQNIFGSGFEMLGGAAGCSGWDIINSTITKCGYAGVLLNANSPNINHIRIFNNIIYNIDGGTGYVVRSGDTCSGGCNPATTLVQNNLAFLASGGMAGTGWFTATGNIVADPLFVSYNATTGGGDLHLQVSSPAIDAGVATGAPVLDYDGTTRPSGATYDIGAYEYLILSGMLAGTGTLVGTLSTTAPPATDFIPRALSALLINTTALGATLAGVGTLSGSLSAQQALSALTLVGNSTLAGASITEATALTSTLVGIGQLSASGQLTTALTSTLAGTSQLSGSVLEMTALTSTLAGVGALSGTLTGVTSLTATLTGVGSLAGTFSSGGALTVVVPGVGSLSALLSATYALNGPALSGVTSISGALSATFSMSGATTAGNGQLSGSLQLATALALTTSGVGQLSGLAALSAPLTSGALVGSGTLSGTLSLRTQLAAALSGVGISASVLSASLTLGSVTLTGIGTLSGIENLTTALTDSLTGTGTLTASLTAMTPLTATLAGSGQLSGAISGGGALAVVGAGIGTLTAALAAALSMSGTTAVGTGTLTGALSARVALTSTLSGVGSSAATPSLGVAWIGVLVGAGTLSGTSILSTSLFVIVPGASSLGGTLIRTAWLSVVYTGNSQLSASLILGGGQLSMCLFAGRGMLVGVFSFPGKSVTATWQTRDLSTIWKTRDGRATWKTRDLEDTWKVRR